MTHDLAALYPGVRPESPCPAGYDLRTAAGYQAWRADGGRWADETPVDDEAAEAAA